MQDIIIMIIKKEINYTPSFRTSKVSGMFDIPVQEKLKKEWNINLPIDQKKWNIGCIVGSSGSGKTTIAKFLFKDNYHTGFEWKNNSFLDDFHKNIEIKDIINALSHVGFSSPPCWLLPYECLSNGQKFRAEIARSLLEYDDIIVFDEFTSVVDRTVAKIGSAAVSKTIKKTGKKFVAVSCHYDILEWLEPDWVFDVDKNEFQWVHLRRPKIKLNIHECSNQQKYKLWEMFKNHHYLSSHLSSSCKAFVGVIDGKICSFTSYIYMCYCKGSMVREHRTVVLPDFQGIGIGNLISEFLGEYVYENLKKPFYSLTSHPAMIFYRNKSKKWQMISKPSVGLTKHNKKGLKEKSSFNRLTASFRYIPGL